MKTFAKCVAIGTAVTLALFGLGYVASALGAESLSYALYWQAYAIFQMVPCNTVLSNGQFFCDSEQAGRMVFYSGIPIGIVIYSAAAWLVLRLLRQPQAAAPTH